jgi:hypothetical protein
VSLWAWGVATATLGAGIAFTGAFMELTSPTSNGGVTAGLMIGIWGGLMMLMGVAR